MASLVPEPIEKCAVCAASPSRTTLPCRQLWQRSVPKLIHLELLACTAWSPRMWREQLADPARSTPRPTRRAAGCAGASAPEAGGSPDRVVHLDDERAAGRVVGVAVDLHHAVRRRHDVELERVEDQVRAEPHVLAAARSRGRGRTLSANAVRGRRVRPVGGDHQVVVARSARQGPAPRCGSASRTPSSAQRCCRICEQPAAAHRGEPVPAAGDHLAAKVHVDVVPAGELALHRARRPAGRRARCRRASRRRTPRRSRTCRRERCAPRR